MRNEKFYWKDGLTYNLMSRGAMGARVLSNSAFDPASLSLFLEDSSVDRYALLAFLNTHIVSYLLRLTSQGTKFNGGYVSNLPIPAFPMHLLSVIGRTCVSLKYWLSAYEPLERGFQRLLSEQPEGHTLLSDLKQTIELTQSVQVILHSLEGLNEHQIINIYELNNGDVRAVQDETGTPASWHPLITGCDTVPEPPGDITLPDELLAHLREHLRHALTPEELAPVKDRLRTLYRAGPGVTLEEKSDENTEEGEEESEAVLGARIVIPIETFLEELSQKLEIHPISVYWLLKEMREQEGLVCPPELKRHLEDYVSITVLRLLGYRWPEQDAYEREHGPIIDPSLVVEDGIIPLVPCGDQPTAAERVRRRLERDFGDEGASRSEAEFRQWVGRSIEDWLKRDFFRRHVQQFRQRPIALHLVSPERTIEVFILYHKLSRATLQKVRAQYAGGLIARLQAEQARAKARGDAANVSRLQVQIEDVEEFRSLIEAIERGEELQYRIRCRWKGEEQNGRPGPYAPDIDDGVKVNIRPFQEAGLLAVKEVIRKW